MSIPIAVVNETFSFSINVVRKSLQATLRVDFGNGIINDTLMSGSTLFNYKSFIVLVIILIVLYLNRPA